MKFDFRNTICFILWIGFLYPEFLYGQTGELYKKKQENIEKLNYTRELLDKTTSTRTTSIQELKLIQRNIQFRSDVIDNIGEELGLLKVDIDITSQEIKNLEALIKILKADYAKLIIAASRNLEEEDALMYIFSSADFNQAYQRLKYLKYLTQYRKKIVNEMMQKEEELKNIHKQLIDFKVRNERLLKEQNKELLELEKDRTRKERIVGSLQSREIELKKELKRQEQIQAEIEYEIRRKIEEEAKARKENTLTPEEKLISGEFARNYGRLPWPSEKGIITGKYGEQNHPVLKGIKVRSNGVDISTVGNTLVRCVFDGEVTKVVAILGANYTIIVKHGEYWTVYQNLVDVRVKAGDKVKAKSVLGTVFTDQDNYSGYHFEVWKGKLTQDPELWLSK